MTQTLTPSTTAAPTTRQHVTDLILVAKRGLGLSYTAIAEALGTHRVWTTSALLGQHPFPAVLADKLCAVLELPEACSPILQEVPMRGSFEALPPTDPTIYRLYEALQVYGPALKYLIHEDFGDGIMSAINFDLQLGRVSAEDGERVQITLTGKFLPYKW
ncbi:cyanase [Deinococcus radiomollis]|uniref:cyanase n=1 Tax=Deinococcus radiomollis TaxID=468916 RepID=UPI003892BC32